MNKEEKIVTGVGYILSIPQLVSAIIFLLLGIFMVVTSTIASFHSDYIETTAIIVDKEYSSDREGYIPIYEFYVDKEKVRVEGIISSDESEIKVGEEITIRYNPEDYEQFDVGSNDSGFMTLIIGALFLFISGGFIYNLASSFMAYKRELKNSKEV